LADGDQVVRPAQLEQTINYKSACHTRTDG